MRDVAPTHAEQRSDPWRIAPVGGDTAKPRNLARRVSWIERRAGGLAGRRVLDAGCGAGDYSRALAARGARVHGVEIDRDKLAKSRLAPGAQGILVCGDLERAPFASASFDLVLYNEVLEYVTDDAAALRESFRLLRPGGALVVFAPNRLFPFETHAVHARRSGRQLSHALPGLPWLPLGVGRLLLRYSARNYWPWQLAGLLRASGFAVRERGFAWPTFENSSGRQPRWMRPLASLLRAVATGCEHLPGLRALGASQLLVAVKGEVSA